MRVGAYRFFCCNAGFMVSSRSDFRQLLYFTGAGGRGTVVLMVRKCFCYFSVSLPSLQSLFLLLFLTFLVFVSATRHPHRVPVIVSSGFTLHMSPIHVYAVLNMRVHLFSRISHFFHIVYSLLLQFSSATLLIALVCVACELTFMLLLLHLFPTVSTST